MGATTEFAPDLPTVSVGRTILVAGLALVIGGQVVRQALVSDPAANPAMAAVAWPGHPDIISRFAMDRVGQRAAAGQPPEPADVRELLSLANKAPLAVEPFLVRGVASQVSGDDRLAGQAFQEARRRDPRSIPARYFLATHYERTGNVRQGLEEISALLRLVPTSVNAVAPQLANYARRPEARPAVRSLLRAHPELEPAILGTLAKDGNNADLILDLAAGGGSTPASREWQSRLVGSLVAEGQFDKAQALWAAFAQVPESENNRLQIFNPQFAQLDAPPPFNWSLASTAAGVAEYAQGGGLHIVYYGRDTTTLASQVLRLPPAQYGLATKMGGGGNAATSLVWKIVCLPGRTSLLELPFNVTGGGSFSVPTAGCAAQQIELAGTMSEMPQIVDVTIRQVSVVERKR